MRGGMPLRSLGVLMLATAATAGFYGVSHTVAKERQALVETRVEVRATRAAIRRLKTELGTRASMRQLERWNAEVLGLGVPGPGQFVVNAGALASLDRDGVRPGRAGGPPILVEAAHRPEQFAAATPVPTVSLPRPVPVASDVSITRVVVERRRQREAMVTEERARPAKVALAPVALAPPVTVALAAPVTAAAHPTRVAAGKAPADARPATKERPVRSERLAEMERRLAAAVGGEL